MNRSGALRLVLSTQLLTIHMDHYTNQCPAVAVDVIPTQNSRVFPPAVGSGWSATGDTPLAGFRLALLPGELWS